MCSPQSTLTLSVKDALTTLGFTPDNAITKPSVGSLILVAHSPSALPPSHLLLVLLPTLLTSIKSNQGLDESLAILLRSLTNATAECPKHDLGEDVITSLLDVLPYLASVHPDPNIRHQTFRIISLVLSLTPPTLRLQLLVTLTSDTSPPPMCAAAVGLIKEAVIEALSHDTSPNILASPLLLQSLAPVLFPPRPRDLFSLIHSTHDLTDSQELSRIVECLSLYYFLLLRDKKNLVRRPCYCLFC